MAKYSLKSIIDYKESQDKKEIIQNLEKLLSSIDDELLSQIHLALMVTRPHFLEGLEVKNKYLLSILRKNT